MATIHEAMAIALGHHQAGRLQAAEQIYRQILEVEPNQPDALHLLGVIAHQSGRQELAIQHIGAAIQLNNSRADFHNNLGESYRALQRISEAVVCYQRALQLKPDFTEAHFNLGNALRHQGRLAEAVACFQRALQLKPDYVEANYCLGNAMSNLGRPAEAVACYQCALQSRPDYAEAHNNLGIALSDQRRLAEAIACYQRALELKPKYAWAHNNLGNAMRDQGQFSEAVACYQRAVQLQPDFVEAHNNLGIALSDQGQLAEAIACYQRALQLKPDCVEAHSNLGNALSDQRQFAEAIACYQRGLELKPDYAEVHNNLGVVLHEQGQISEAVACYQRALQFKPDYAEAHNNLGVVLHDKDQNNESIACYQRALQLKPDYPSALGKLVHELQHVCLWEDLSDLSRGVSEAVEREAPRTSFDIPSPFSFLALPTPTTAKQQQRCARQWVDQCFQWAVTCGQQKSKARSDGDKSRIRLGYLSADFYEHATAYLMAELFEKHNRDRFEILGYSYGPDDGSPMRTRLLQAFDRFADLKDASFADAAQRIEADGVDILVDLKGYTQNCRTQILALRPAPIQVNYLGYPGTMGAAFMDYILVDDFIVPADQQPFFTEKLVHLPGCYQVNDSRREISPHTPSRAECGLPEQGFVFCSFNNTYKITPAMFEVWMKLLQAVPGSVLWLLEGNEYAPANLRKEAEARGVPAERLVFASRRPLADHLARHRLADLFLDTFPYNAHTTASDALWAGCPVLTLAGETFISRVAGSLLRTIGLPELITDSLAEYQDMALRLVRNPDLLGELRARLAANRKTSRLFDAGQFSRSIEQAYATMWEIHCAGEPPRTFRVPLPRRDPRV